MSIPSGRKKKVRVPGYVSYALLSVLDRITDKTGKSRCAVIAEALERALPDVAEENKIRVPRHLPGDRKSYLFWRHGL